MLAGTYLTVENNDNKGNLPREDQNSFIENQITELFRQLRTVSLDVQNAFLRWTSTRHDAMKQLEVLNTNDLKYKIPATTGTSVAWILSLVGFTAAPVTGGMVAIAFFLAGSMAVLGGLVMSTSCRTKRPPLESHQNKALQLTIQKDQEACSDLQKQFYNLEFLISQLGEFFKPLHVDPMLQRLLEGSGFDFLREREIYEDGVSFFRGATTSARASASSAMCSFVLTVLLPLSSWIPFKCHCELNRGSPDVENVKRIMTELESSDVEVIKGLVESFIEKKFTEAYSRIDCDKQTENQVGDADDADDDYVQYGDETSRATAERQRLLPEGR